MKNLFTPKLLLLVCVALLVTLAILQIRQSVFTQDSSSPARSGDRRTISSYAEFQPAAASLPSLLEEMREMGALREGYSEWFVSPEGNASGKGSISSPLDLATALGGGAKGIEIKPGDIVWLRGGVYNGAFTSRLKGSTKFPVVVRQYPGERAVIDKADAGRETAALAVRGSHVWFWDFEVANSFPDRSSNDPSGDLNPWRGSGINVWAPDTKYINLVVRDNGHGFGLWNEDGGTEIYGCLIFNNGNNKKEHGVYAHNAQGTQTIADNAIFNNAGYGLHVYANSPKSRVSGFDISGNAVFNNGSISPADQVADQILVGGVTGAPASRIVLRENFVYTPPDAPTGKNRGVRLGYEDTNNQDASLIDNYVVSRVPLKILWWQSIEARGNTIVSDKSAEIDLPETFVAANYRLDANRHFGKARQLFNITQKNIDYELEQAGSAGQQSAAISNQPRVFIRPNKYEKGRALLIVYNPGLKPGVAVDLTSFLRKGDNFEIRDTQNYFDDPVMQGVFDGGEILLTSRGKRATPPLGETSQLPSHTNSDFGVFVIRKIVRK